jgi:hypothetical protein
MNPTPLRFPLCHTGPGQADHGLITGAPAEKGYLGALARVRVQCLGGRARVANATDPQLRSETTGAVIVAAMQAREWSLDDD